MGVFGADRVRRVVGKIDAADRHADVVEYRALLRGGNHGADFCFDFVGDTRSFLDARAGWCAQVKADITRIDGRKKVASDKRHEHERTEAQQQKQRNKAAALGNRAFERTAIDVAQRLETPLEAGLKACEYGKASG